MKAIRRLRRRWRFNRMQDGTYNVYWWLSLIAPAVIMLIARATRSRKIYWLAVVCSVIVTYVLCLQAVELKWAIRNATATLDSEIERATSDGANLVFNAILLAPLQAVLFTWFWGWIGRQIWKSPQTSVAP